MGSRLGALLRTYRSAAGITQETLAERSGLSVKAISALERGVRRFPQQPTIGVLADALNLDDTQRNALIAAASRGGPVAERPPSALPRQLPPAIADFTGRTEEVSGLIGLLSEARTQVVAVVGMGGVGKTALAVHVAHAVTGCHPDGQVYVDLRGYSPGDPVTETQALRHLLSSLGADIDLDDLDAAAARYRSAIAGRRMLVVLDNALDATQVRRLLPVGSGSAAVVTSRRAMAGLPEIRLDTLPENDALAMLASLAGDELVRTDRASASEIVRHCGFLPLAIRLAGARLAARPGWTVRHLADRLRDEPRRLGELQTDVEAAEALRKLAGSKHRTIGLASAARLLNLPQASTKRLLGRLVDTSLLLPRGGGRYQIHDLVRFLLRQRHLPTPRCQ